MITARHPEPLSSPPATVHHVWYAAYGSNMHQYRLSYYLRGGRPPGNARTYPGCRDPRPPGRALPVMLPGQLYFAMESAAWTGGMAFYDPDASGETPAGASLLTAGQFADIAAQEMRRQPGSDLNLRELLVSGRIRLGPGRYETLVCAGLLDGCPVLTFTAPWRSHEVEPTAPSAAYLRHLASGLAEAHAWAPLRIARYLAGRPGVRGVWDANALAALFADPGALGSVGSVGETPGALA